MRTEAAKLDNDEEKQDSHYAEKALTICWKHPADARILLTDSPDGLYAARDPEVKAVIWHRKTPAAVQEALDNLSETQLRSLAETFGYASRSGRKTEYSLHAGAEDLCNMPPVQQKIHKYVSPLTDLPPALIEDITKLNEIFCRAVGREAARGWFADSVRRKTYGIHIDGASHGPQRMHVSYMGTGLEWFPGKAPTEEEYKALAKIQSTKDYPPGLRSEFTRNGDVVLFRKRFPMNALDKKGGIPGLLHRSPDPTDERGLIYIVDMR